MVLAERWREALRRGRGHAGCSVAGSALAVAACAGLLYDRLIARGEYASPHEQEAEDAAWEARYVRAAPAFSVRGGEVVAELPPSERVARARWTLHEVRSSGSALHASLAPGMRIASAHVDGAERSIAQQYDHAVIELGACAADGCKVELEVASDIDGWPAGDETPWLHGSGAFARARDLLPRLGLDPGRVLRAPDVRRAHGLPEKLPELPEAAALVPALGVAPAGEWRWSVLLPEHGMHTSASGTSAGLLDFAVVWLPDGAARQTARDGVAVWHGQSRVQVASEVLDDFLQMRRCVGERLGTTPKVTTLVQAPRKLGEISLRGALLWLPEHEGWDVGAQGFGRWQRRAQIARALAARVLADRASLRDEPGARWLLAGVAGFTGLECVRRSDGQDAWMALWSRQNKRAAGALGELDAPIDGLARDLGAAWVAAYAPLSTTGWVAMAGDAEMQRVVDAVVRSVRDGLPLAAALARAAGAETARLVLGEPLASDVAVATEEPQRVHIGGERWRWDRVGWQAALAASDRIVRFEAAPTAGAPEAMRVPTDIAAPQAAFTALDAWPSFERSPQNNVWKGERAGK